MEGRPDVDAQIDVLLRGPFPGPGLCPCRVAGPALDSQQQFATTVTAAAALSQCLGGFK